MEAIASKEMLVRGKLAQIAEGGYIAMPNGTLRIQPSEVAGKFDYRRGDRKPESLDTDAVAKRLDRGFTREILERDLTVFGSIAEANEAIAERDEEVRERVMPPATANGDKKHQGKSKKAAKYPALPDGKDHRLGSDKDANPGDHKIGGKYVVRLERAEDGTDTFIALYDGEEVDEYPFSHKVIRRRFAYHASKRRKGYTLDVSETRLVSTPEGE